jgi:transcriptional regulator with XRE-family HTH domain
MTTYTDTPPPIATRLRQARETLGWSLTTAALEVGVTPASIHRWETGTRQPNVRSLNRLADAYGLRRCDLMEFL